jgi:hypothetical protein
MPASCGNTADGEVPLSLKIPLGAGNDEDVVRESGVNEGDVEMFTSERGESVAVKPFQAREGLNVRTGFVVVGDITKRGAGVVQLVDTGPN